MEFIIADQRVVLEPGDELLYPRGAVMLAKNLHDGEARILISPRR
jgi:quercetin dioxygenase-like cupin family protein